MPLHESCRNFSLCHALQLPPNPALSLITGHAHIMLCKLSNGAQKCEAGLQIFVEIERARLTKQLAKLKEEEGKVEEAAEILQEVAVVSQPVSDSLLALHGFRLSF